MPYKDIKKRREAIRNSVYKLRARKKEERNFASNVINVNPVIPKKKYSNKNASNLQIEESLVCIKKYLSEINEKLHKWKINWDKHEGRKRKKVISKKLKENEEKIKKRKKPTPLSFQSKQILLLKITEWEKKTGITKDKFTYRIWRNEVKMRAMRQVPEYQERERIRSKERWNKKNLQ